MSNKWVREYNKLLNEDTSVMQAVPGKNSMVPNNAIELKSDGKSLSAATGKPVDKEVNINKEFDEQTLVVRKDAFSKKQKMIQEMDDYSNDAMDMDENVVKISCDFVCSIIKASISADLTDADIDEICVALGEIYKGETLTSDDSVELLSTLRINHNDEGMEDEGMEDEGMEDEGMEDEGMEDEEEMIKESRIYMSGIHANGSRKKKTSSKLKGGLMDEIRRRAGII